MRKLALVDYGSGNLASARRALLLAAHRVDVSLSVSITQEPAVIRKADYIVLPGQGAFADCAKGLMGLKGLWECIDLEVRSGTPFLGICVGMQLMAERGLEYGVTPGFGWISGEISKMDAPGNRLPHMGWNNLQFEQNIHPLLDGITPGEHVYFVHSYGLTSCHPGEVVATTNYCGTVPAIVARENYVGTQFHVEKSQGVGIKILSNFLKWTQ
jgi:imidazole glycerol-phosphate synthase subunit HisH